MWVRYDGEEFETEEDALDDACDFIDEENLIMEMEREISYKDLVDKILTAKNLEGLVGEIFDQFADARARLFPDLYHKVEDEDEDEEDE